ncbi:MAG: hypothetical protein ACREVV_17470 [Steroidobacteraceae bacterium]
MHNDIDQQTTAVVGSLRQLPSELSPPYDWHEFQRRAHKRLPAAKAAVNWRHAALAAVLVMIVVGVAVWNGIDTSTPSTARATRSDQTATDVTSATDDARDLAASSQHLDAASRAARSRAIESWLASLPREPVVVRVGTRAAVAGLEDQIAQVDDLLTSVRLDGSGAERVAPLQRERARLVGSLAQVRYAEVVAAESP